MRKLLALAALVLATSASGQKTWYVDVDGTPPGTGTLADPYTSIQYAVLQPSTISGDLILVAPGTYPEQVVIAAKGLHVKASSGPAATVIDAGFGGSAVSVLDTGPLKATLEGFTLTHGTGTGSLGTQGGGLFAAGSLVSLVDCIVEANTANAGGGLFFRNCVASVAQCVVRQNAALPDAPLSRHGGGIYLGGGSLDLTDSLVEDNDAGTLNSPGYGGGVYAALGVLNASQSVVRGNVADLGGGGLFVSQGSIESCQIEQNTGQFGGGVLGGAGVFIIDSLLQDNVAVSATGNGHFGGGVYGPVTLSACSLIGNQAFGTGGGAHGATLIDCTLAANWATGGAGAGNYPIVGGAFDCTLTGCVVTRNVAILGDNPPFQQAGGAFDSTLVDCAVFRNAALGSMATGGGLAHCNATLTSLYDNYSSAFGAGVFGGITDRCTLVGNDAALGTDGILDSGLGGVIVTNSIVWNNGQEIRLAPNSLAVVSYCDVKGGFPGAGNIDQDPQLWDEAAGDFHLLASSPCIDAGDPTSPPDPDGSPADMGAFPYDPDYTGD